MLTSITQIPNQPVTILLYEAGSSGEFLSYALTSTIDQFSKIPMVWENNNRCIVQDYFGRTLLFGPINEDLLLSRINLYSQMTHGEGKNRHMCLSHFMPHQIDFLKTHGAMWPVLEITVQHAASKKFQQRARRSKIPKDYQATSQASQTHINRTALQRGFTPANHLEIEWHELFLTDTAATYQKILEFLNCTGNVEQFVDQVNDYVNRNNLLLQETYES